MRSPKRGAVYKVNGGLTLNFENGLNGEVVVNYVGAATYPVRPEIAQFAGLGLISPGAVPGNRVPSYTLLNFRAAYLFWRDRAEVALSVFNAFNDRHREHPLGDVIGSRVMGWVILKL